MQTYSYGHLDRHHHKSSGGRASRRVHFHHGTTGLMGDLHLPFGAPAVVLIAHVSSSGHSKPRHAYLAQHLVRKGLGVMHVELLTPQEEAEDNLTGRLQEATSTLVERLSAAVRWTKSESAFRHLRLGCMGFASGATAALKAAATTPELNTIVAVDANPEPLGGLLEQIHSPILLIASETHDSQQRMNEVAYTRLHCDKEIKIVPGTTALANGEALEEVASMAAGWFQRHLSLARTWSQQPVGIHP